MKEEAFERALGQNSDLDLATMAGRGWEEGVHSFLHVDEQQQMHKSHTM